MMILGTAFVVLKLCGVITWSWWLVLLPFTIPVVIVVTTIIIAAIQDEVLYGDLRRIMREESRKAKE